MRDSRTGIQKVLQASFGGVSHDAFEYSRSRGASSGEQCVHWPCRHRCFGDAGRSRGCRDPVDSSAGVILVTFSHLARQAGFLNRPARHAGRLRQVRMQHLSGARIHKRISRMSHGWHIPSVNAMMTVLKVELCSTLSVFRFCITWQKASICSTGAADGVYNCRLGAGILPMTALSYNSCRADRLFAFRSLALGRERVSRSPE